MPNFKAVVLDLDGVITQTAKLHAQAWKRLFDEYLDKWSAQHCWPTKPFDPVSDYLKYVDGKARQDGVQSFLSSRGISIPLGDHADPPGAETCHGLGNLKDGYFKEILLARGPEVFKDAVATIKKWRKQGLKIAVASSSKNCAEILRLAGLTDLFDVRVDGTHLQKWDLPGKPAPELFLSAAYLLHVDPSEAILFEDAISGVEAGRRGGFGLVVGVARHGSPEALRDAGADIVVSKLTELDLHQAIAEISKRARPPMPGLRTELTESERKKIAG